ncbi:MAG: response regulator transcription factor [Dehalococcoidia bacterium]|nr:response regulator transcription factor [Dehalococcoidia bacterium]
MYNVLLIPAEREPNAALLQRLAAEKISYTLASNMEALPDTGPASSFDAVLVDLGTGDRSTLLSVAERCRTLHLPLLCGLPSERLPTYENSWGAADFFVVPPAAGEVTARIRQARQLASPNAAKEGGNILQVGDLRINLDRYEVSNRGEKVLLTFKEYQLLCALASNPGRVFTREQLLTQIWEYDYFGGTRTVDVHVRRLRSKIEDMGETYIETVWNVGYRFRNQDAPAR